MSQKLFTFLLLFIGFQAFTQPAISLDQNGANIGNTTTYSFGSVNVGSQKEVVFTISNSTSDTLLIDDITISPSTFYTVSSPLSSDSIKGVGSLDFTIELAAGCSVQTHNATVTITNNDPLSSSFTFNLTGNTTALAEVAAAGNDETICNTTYSLVGNTPSQTTGQWTVTAGSGTFNDNTSPGTQVSNVGVGINTYKWSLYSGTCLISEDEVTITRDAFPGPVNAGTDKTICGTQSVSLVATTPTVGSGTWTKFETAAIIQSPNAPISSVTNLSLDTNIFIWTVSDPGSTCGIYRDTTLIIRDENPTKAEAGTDKNICQNSYKLDANTPVVGTGKWSVVSGAGVFQNNLSDSSLVSGFNYGTNVYKWTIRSKYGFCAASSDNMTLFRDTEPTIVDAGADVTICEDTVRLNALPPDAGVGQWIVAGGGSTVLEPSNPKSKVQNLDNGTNTFIWVVTSGSCTSSPDAVIVDRDDDLTPAEAGEDQFLCKDSTTSMAANTPIKGFGKWTRTFGSANILNLTDQNTEIKALSIGKNTFVWTISSGTCTPSSDTINVFRDGVSPEIDCPNNIVVDNDAGICGATVNYITPIGTDNCPDPITSQIAGLASGAVFPIGVTTNTFEVLDFYDYSATCSFTVTVVDTTLPQISCIDTIKQNNSLDDCGKIVSFTIPVGTDNCSGFSTTQTKGIGYTSGSMFPIGHTTLEYTVTDASGNTASCQTVVSVRDVQKPTIVCPSNIDQDLTFGNCDAFITYPDPVIDDNCVNDELQYQLTAGLPSGSNFPSGVTTNTFVVTDSSGNTATCSFTVTINDVETPQITCPGDITTSNISGICGAVVSYPDPSVNDLCNNSTLSLLQGQVSGSTFPMGTTLVEYQVEDAAGNTDACSFDITVNDTEIPTILCPANINKTVTPGLCEAAVTYTLPTGNDNCTGFSIAQIDATGLSSGSNFPEGTTTLTYEVTDASGNTAQCSFDVIVSDNEVPTISCPADIATTSAPGLCEKQVVYTTPTGGDNCGLLGISQIDATGLSSGANFPVGKTTLTYEAEDLSGNTATCSFNVFVKDINAPQIICPNDTTVTAASGLCSENINYFDPIVSDLCGPASFSLLSGNAKGTTFSVGTHTITYQAIDTAGNTASCSFDITVTDDEVPQILCPGNVNQNVSPGLCEATVTYTLPTGNDNCAGFSIAQIDATGLSSGSNFPEGTTTLTYEVTDASGNIAQCSFDVIVSDNEVPTISCPADIATTSAPGLCEKQVFYSVPTGADNCGLFGISQIDATGLSSGSNFPVGKTTLTYEAEDLSGNTATCSFNVFVKDINAPVIVCPNDTTVYTKANGCTVNVNYFDPAVSDLCGPASFSLSSGKIKGTAFGLGTHPITYQAIDTAGNTASCSFDVSVLDTIRPNVICGSDVELFTSPGICSANYSFSLPGATDNCDSVRVLQVKGPVSGSTFPLGETMLAFIAYDSTGNKSDTCKITVTVLDKEDPTITCPSTVVRCTQGIVNFPSATAVDNCSSVITINQTSGPTSGTSLSVGSYQVTFSASDEYGNKASCATTIQVYDTTFHPVAGVDVAICGETTTLNGNVPQRSEILSWSSVTSGPIIVSPSSSTTSINSLISSGDYKFVYTFNRNSCGIQRDTVVITKNLSPGPAKAGNDTIICGTNTVVLKADVPAEGTGNWDVVTGSGTITPLTATQALFESLSDGVNKVVWRVNNSLCPEVRDTVYIRVSDNPNIEIEAPEPVLYGEIAQLFLTTDTVYFYEWEPFDAFDDPFVKNPEGTFEKTTWVKVTATSKDGCTSIDSVQLEVINELKIYTGLTPNDDQLNDYWVIRGIQAYPDARIEVFSQWGQPVFSSIGYDTPWDGKKDGKVLPFGPYYYVIDLGNGEVKNGTVTLIR